MFRIFIRNESWVYYNHPESKMESMDWKHTCYPRSKQSKVIRGSKKRMATVFGNLRGLYQLSIFLRLILWMLTTLPIFWIACVTLPSVNSVVSCDAVFCSSVATPLCTPAMLRSMQHTVTASPNCLIQPIPSTYVPANIYYFQNWKTTYLARDLTIITS